MLAGLPWPGKGQEPAEARRTGEHRIPFIARDGAVYVRARVNGSRVTLLLDTGAVWTTFNQKLVPTQTTGSRITINMAKGTVPAFRLAVALTLGESSVKEEHCSFRQEAIVGDFNFGAADGVVGLDVLSSFKSVTLDFKNSTLILEDR
jgi:predicted aspartyl protease